jgi:hypothetical protein
LDLNDVIYAGLLNQVILGAGGSITIMPVVLEIAVVVDGVSVECSVIFAMFDLVYWSLFSRDILIFTSRVV